MKQYKIVIQEAARLDLLSVINYIIDDFQEPAIAQKTYRAIMQEIESLKELPKRTRVLQDEPYKSKGYRVTYAKHYAIFYKVIESTNEVYIMRILYNRRDWKNLL